MIGKLLNDRYLIESELGRGGMGFVYQARDTLLERDVAIKVVSGSALGTEGQNRLLKEARAEASLNHPNIVAIYDVGESSNLTVEASVSTYIVMELVQGQALNEREFDELENLEKIVDIIKQICAALVLAHSQGIIHRDLKPENVIVADTGTVKLMDFGLARVAGGSRLTQEGALVGTFNYIAPELILGQEASVQSDLYALGVMFYELTAGRPPFEGDSPTAILSQHLYAPIVPPSAYNERLRPAIDLLILRLLKKQPQDRPNSAGEVLESLELGFADVAAIQPRANMIASTPGFQLNRLVRGRLVGREEEFAQAAAVWQLASAGQGQVLFISGEPGIGKTRLVRELTTYVEVSGGRVLASECYEQGGVPYMPIAQIIRAALSDGANLNLPDSLLTDLVTLAPDLRLRYPKLHGPDQLEAEQLKLYESVVVLCQEFSERTPLLLLVDDLHWADSGSLGLLHHLARRSFDLPILIVGTYREVELTESRPTRQMLRDIDRERTATRIKLKRLNQKQTGEMLATLFAEEISPDFLNSVYHETEGNPFFVEEVCRSLIESGKLYFEAGHWQRPDTGELEIPQGVQLAIESRLERIEDQERNVLRIGALLGREFRYDMLAAISELDEDNLIIALENSEKMQLIEEVKVLSPGRIAGRLFFSFTHALIQSTLLAQLSTLRRQRLQRSVALKLEHSYPDEIDELAPMLGRYLAEAGDGEKAIPYLLQTGNSAQRVYAYEEAIEAYEQALIFLRELNDLDLASRTLMQLGLAYLGLYQFGKSRQAYDEAFALQMYDSVEPGAPLEPAPNPFRMIGIEPITLDPSLSGDTVSSNLIEHLFAGLVKLTADGRILPDVAERWEILDGGQQYIFYLRDDALWSDGTPVTAHDFEFAWKRALEPGRDSNPANMLYDVKSASEYHAGTSDTIGANVIDDFTFAVELEVQTGYFLQLLSQPVAFPIPRHVVEKHGDDWSKPYQIVNNGPFLIEKWRKDESAVFLRNHDYRAHNSGNLEQFNLYFIDPEVELAWYKEDKLDVFSFHNQITTVMRRMIRQHPGEYISGPAATTSYIWFDQKLAPFDDVRVRRAFALAMDKNALIAEDTVGLYYPATGGIVPPAIPGHTQDNALPFDPVKARHMFAEAGFPGGRGFPEMVLVTYEQSSEVMQIVVDQWTEMLGVKVRIETTDLGQFRKRYESDPPHCWFLGWTADYPDPDNFLRAASWRPLSGWQHDTYDRLIEEARRVSDQARRLEIYREAEQILIDQAPVLPIIYVSNHMFAKPWVKGLKFSPTGTLLTHEIIIEPH